MWCTLEEPQKDDESRQLLSILPKAACKTCMRSLYPLALNQAMQSLKSEAHSLGVGPIELTSSILAAASPLSRKAQLSNKPKLGQTTPSIFSQEHQIS